MSRLDILENDFWNVINSNPLEAERIADLMRDIQCPECELTDDGKCRHCGWEDINAHLCDNCNGEYQ